MFDRHFDKHAGWLSFISGAGFERAVEVIETLKREMSRSLRKSGKDKAWLIRAIRLEHLQIRKHQKIAMKYLQQLEDKLLDDEVKEELRRNFKDTYKVK